MSARKTTRVQLELGPLHMTRLRELKRAIGATTYAEVVRRALESYHALVTRKEPR